MFRWLVSSIILFAILSTQSAYSADIQLYRVLGFAKNGSIFIYEIYNDFDGSGGGQSIYYALDTKNDKWVAGTPIKYAVREGNPELDKISLAEIRRRSRNQADDFLKSVGDIDPGIPVVVRSLGDYTSDSKRIEFGFPIISSAYRQWSKHRIELETKDFINPDEKSREFLPTCKGLIFRLNDEEFYRDKRIPKSRYCPSDYKIAEIRWNQFTNVSVVFVSVLFQGFEGLQRELITIPMSAKVRNDR